MKDKTFQVPGVFIALVCPLVRHGLATMLVSAVCWAGDAGHEAEGRSKETSVVTAIDLLRTQIQEKEDQIDQFRMKLRITDAELVSGQYASFNSEVLKQMKRQTEEIRVSYLEMATLHEALSKLDRDNLKKALPTAAPDSLLSSLLQNQSEAEQKMAAIQSSYGESHPERRSVQVLLDTINRQIEERLSGILLGLKMRAKASQVTMERLQKELEDELEKDVERSIAVRPLLQAQRELEALRLRRDRMKLRLEQMRFGELLGESIP